MSETPEAARPTDTPLSDKATPGIDGGGGVGGEAPRLVDFALAGPEFLAGQDEPQEWLIDGLFPHPSAGMLYGWRGIGKTHCAISFAVAVASGGAWLDDDAMTPKTSRVVLYLDGEMSRRSLRCRFRRATGGAMPQNLIVVPVEEYAKSHPKPNLAEPEGRRAVVQLIADIQERYGVEIELVIIDNWVSFVRGIDEDDNAALGDIANWMTSLRAQGLSVLFVHHAGKAGSQRGASAREDLLDYVIGLDRPEGWRPYGPAHFVVKLEKAREMPDPMVWEGALEAKLENGEWHTEFASDAKAERRREVETALLMALANKRPLNSVVSNGAKRTELLRKLDKEGLVRKAGNGKTDPWAITELGLLELTKRAPDTGKSL